MRHEEILVAIPIHTKEELIEIELAIFWYIFEMHKKAPKGLKH